MIYDIGRVCVKIAGRDAGKKCVIVEKIDDKFVLIDGETRRRKVNIAHVEPTNEVLKLTASANRAAVVKAFEGLNVVLEESTKAKKTAPRMKKVHHQNEKKSKPSKK